jgi:hypothetical protein
MIIVLPDAIAGLDAVIGAFDTAELARLRAELERATLTQTRSSCRAFALSHKNH